MEKFGGLFRIFGLVAVVNHAKTTKIGILQKTDENKSENRTTAQNQGQN